jgi:hypothetical protein
MEQRLRLYRNHTPGCVYQSKTPAKIGFVVKLLLKEVADKLSTYRLERVQTFQKYGTEVEPGKWLFPPEQMEAFTKEMEETERRGSGTELCTDFDQRSRQCRSLGRRSGLPRAVYHCLDSETILTALTIGFLLQCPKYYSHRRNVSEDVASLLMRIVAKERDRFSPCFADVDDANEFTPMEIFSNKKFIFL